LRCDYNFYRGAHNNWTDQKNWLTHACNHLINYQQVEAQGDIPCDVITISTVDEYNIAKLMFSYQLLVSAIGEFLQINTYNQPVIDINLT
jgi:glucose-6-phosphate isomerase